MGVGKLAGTMFPHGWLEPPVHLDTPSMIGWIMGSRAHQILGARKLRFLVFNQYEMVSKIPKLDQQGSNGMNQLSTCRMIVLGVVFTRAS